MIEKCVGKLKQPSMKSPGASLEHLQKSYDPLFMSFVDVLNSFNDLRGLPSVLSITDKT